jgi:hypothetical protein
MMASEMALAIAMRNKGTTETVGALRLANDADAELQEVREVLDELRWQTAEAEPCWCRVRVNGIHDETCQRTGQLAERLRVG